MRTRFKTYRVPDVCLSLVVDACSWYARAGFEEGRPSMAQGANMIQMALKVGDTPLANYDDGTTKVILGRAIDTYNMGASNIGQKAYAFFRYYNKRYPHLAGPYSQMVTFFIS